MCSKSRLCVDQLLEQEIPEDCLLLRLSQWFGSPCGWMPREGTDSQEEEVGTQRSLCWDLWSVTFLESF